MERSEKTMPKKRLILIFVLTAVLMAGSAVGIFLWGERERAPVLMQPLAYINISCGGYYREIYDGMDTSNVVVTSNYRYDLSYLPSPDDTEEQRRQRAENATIRDALRFEPLAQGIYTEKIYEEELAKCMVREDGMIIRPEQQSDPYDMVVRTDDGKTKTVHKEKAVLLDIPLSLDTKLDDLFQNDGRVDKEASILQTKKQREQNKES